MRLILVGDPHYRTKGSLYRKDDYYSTQLDKLKQIIQKGEAHKVDGIVFLGDVTHSPKESHQLVYDLLSIFKTTKIKLYTIVGNHDITGWNLSTLKQSPLGVLINSGALNLIEGYQLFPDEVVIKGVPYKSDHGVNDYIFLSQYDKQLRIVLTHNMIAPLGHNLFEYLHPDQIKTNASIFFVGHYHHPYDFISNVLPHKPRFTDVGIPMRWKTDEANISPKVALLNVSYSNGIHTYNIQYLPLEAKPGHEVFNLVKVQEIKDKDQNIEDFVQTLETTSFTSTNLEESILQYGKNQGIDTQVIQELLRLVREKRGIYGT